jgi:hypothetical protein
MTYFFERHKIDISRGYCSSRRTTPDPNFTTVELPPDPAVNADYGLSVLGQREAALREMPVRLTQAIDLLAIQPNSNWRNGGVTTVRARGALRAPTNITIREPSGCPLTAHNRL